MTGKDLSQKIFDQIKTEKIRPKAKWEFVIKDSFVWALVIVSLLLGSLATSMAVYMIDNNEWDLYKKVGGNIFLFILVALPYFWLIILAVFVLFIYYNFKHTKGGYKYRAYAVILTSVLLSLISGVLFYNLGFARSIDDILDTKAPLYNSLVERKEDLFHQPAKGVLPGRIIKVLSPTEILIIDPRQKQWQVLIGEIKGHCHCQEGRRIMAVGEIIGNDIFNAFQIRELRPAHFQPRKIQQYLRLRIMGNR